jgi:DNA-binding response OmpR family regulator
MNHYANVDSEIRLAKILPDAAPVEIQLRELLVRNGVFSYHGTPTPLGDHELLLVIAVMSRRGGYCEEEVLDREIWGNVVGASNRLSTLVSCTNKKFVTFHVPYRVSEVRALTNRDKRGRRLEMASGAAIVENRIRILVCDGDASWIEVYKIALEPLGFEIEPVSARDVVAAMRGAATALLVTEMDHFDEILRCRTDVPIFVVTRACSQEAVRRVEALGHTICPKPVGSSVLRPLVRAIVQNRSLGIR